MRASVKKWAGVVKEELARSGYPLPPEHVLAVMDRESRGYVGAVNPSSGASGLMQVMPIALKDYNQNNKQKYSMDNLRAKTFQAGRIQIRVGLWILARFVKGAYNYLKKKLGNVHLDDLIKTADFFYAAGPGNAKKKLNTISRPTYDSVKNKFPKWDRVIPAQRVWDWVKTNGGKWDTAAIDRWLEGGILIEKKKTAMGAIVGILAIVLAWEYFGRS